MRRFVLLNLILAPIFLIFSATNSIGETIFQDDFESYSVGTFPSSGGWELVYSGYGTSFQVVTDGASVSPIRSLKLEGRSNWAAGAARQLPSIPDVVIFEVSVRTMKVDPSVMNYHETKVGLWSDVSGSWVWHAIVGFRYSGKIDFGVDGNWNIFETEWEPNAWYNVKIKYDNVKKRADLWINGGLVVSDADMSGPSGSYDSIILEGGNDTHTRSWFDDVKVYTESSTTTTTTSTTTNTTTSSTSSTTTSTTSSTTTTLTSIPIVITGQAEAYTESATLNGTINPNGSMSYYYFEYGTTSGYGYDTPLKIIGSGTTEIHVSAYIEGLRKDTLYHCRLVAYNGVGMTEGQDIVFNTIIGEINDSKAIIVAGGGPYAENNIWEEVEEVAACAYRALLTQGYSKDIVYYLSPNTLHDVDGDGLSDVSADATGVNLEYAIKSWPQDVSQLVIFLVGHGGKERFKIGEKTEITVQVLDGWLDDTQNGMIQQAVVVYDACHSGSFLPLFSPPAGKERILATSSKSNQSALILADGKLSFSYLFWTSIRNGDSFYDSFVSTKNALSIAHPGLQDSQIEGNGNGIGDEKDDKSLAGQVKVGLELKSGADLPSIGSVSASPENVSVGSSSVICAEGVSALEGVNNVWAVITPPGYSAAPDTPVTDLPILDLSFINGRYEGTYGGFVTPGVYNIAVFAEDDKGFVSVPVKTTVTATGNGDPTCLSVSGGLGIPVPCAEYNGDRYGFTLDFYHNPDDMSGYYWKMVMSTLTTGSGLGCIPIETDLNMFMECVSYNGTQYGFTLKFYNNTYDPSGYYWKMDMSTLVVK